jgi:hypothetical protein
VDGSSGRVKLEFPAGGAARLDSSVQTLESRLPLLFLAAFAIVASVQIALQG